ncbi:MAG: glycerate kinase type-2 family protein [Candidatus Villigracilaceae bacterium]
MNASLPYLTPPQVRIVQAALQAAEPGAAVRRSLQRDGHFLTIAGQTYNLQAYTHIYLTGGGKAASPMSYAAAEMLETYFTSGFLVTKTGHIEAGAGSRFPGLILAEASHPIPDRRGVLATRRILSLAKNANRHDLLICLLSGGGSALLTAPHVPLADLQTLTAQLLACGADIHEINTLRKHLDAVKGGGLAIAAHPARMVTLILSDVVGDQLDVIASGPTTADSSTFQHAWAVLEKYALRPPASILRHLQKGLRGEIAETPKPGDPRLANVQNVIIGSNRLAAQAAYRQARREGYNACILTTRLQGEAAQVGRKMALLARRVSEGRGPVRPPACLIAGGETTVTLHGSGLGGRNQELALAAVDGLAGLTDVTLAALATDGGDGPTDAAGAVVTSQTRDQAQRLGLEPQAFLSENNAYHFFHPLGGLIKTGPTRTNVNDLIFIFISSP